MKCAALLVALAGLDGCDSSDEPRAIELWVPCEPFWVGRSAIAVPPGAEFRFSLDESRGPNGESGRDHVGTLDMVEAPGFELSVDPDPAYEGWFLARAPLELGEYTWTIERAERPTTFRVYDPSEVFPVLDEQTYVGRGRTAQVDLALGEHLGVCLYEGEQIAKVTVAGNNCRAVLSTFEIDGPLRASLGDGRFEFQLFGDGVCDVAVELANGQNVARQYEPAAPPLPDVDPPERIITTTGILEDPPIGTGGQCDAAPTDGDCSYPYINDGDCYWDADWRVLQYELDGTMLADDAVIGIGLTTRLEVSLTAFFVAIGPPSDLVLTGLAGLQLSPLGCEGDYKLIRNQPTGGGSHTIELSSSNTSDRGYKTIHSTGVTQTKFRFAPANAPSHSTDASVVEVFVRTPTLLNTEYFGNGTLLHGSAPLAITSDAAAMSGVTDPDTLITGTQPHTLVATSSVTSDSITIHVRDETAITAIDGLQQPVVPLGEQFCLDGLVARGSVGPIYGTSPRGPRVSLGDSLVLTPYAQFGGLCLRGFVPGTTTLSWSWGSATVQTQWTIQ